MTLLLWSLDVYFACENTHSGLDDKAGTDYISVAICDRKGSRVRFSDESHQSIADLLFCSTDGLRVR